MAGREDLLVDGAVVHLWSKQSGRSLKIDDDGNAKASARGCGEYAQFIVHAKAEGEICLQSKKYGNHWLAIKNGEVKGDGTGGVFTHFFVVDHASDFISLESKEARGSYVGSNNEGTLGVRSQTSNDTKFYVMIHKPADGQTVPKGSKLLTDGAKVRLWSNTHGGNVRIQDDGSVDGKGGGGPLTLYTVHKHGSDVVRLQNVQNPNHWIAIKEGGTTGIASGGKFTHLRVHDSEHGMVCFEAVEHPGQHLGVLPDGSCKPPGETGTGKHGQFHVIVC